MTRQSEHNAKRTAAGWQRISSMWLHPDTVAALRELRTRGAVSDAQAVNAAIVRWADTLSCAEDRPI